jgi:hypothetical protein
MEELVSILSNPLQKTTKNRDFTMIIKSWALAIITSPFVTFAFHFLFPTLPLYIGVIAFPLVDWISAKFLILKTGKDKHGNPPKRFKDLFQSEAEFQLQQDKFPKEPTTSNSLNPTIFKVPSYCSIILLISIFERVYISPDSIFLTKGVAAIIASKELISCIENLSKLSGTSIMTQIKNFLLKNMFKNDNIQNNNENNNQKSNENNEK